jgi:hypothetical protein
MITLMSVSVVPGKIAVLVMSVVAALSAIEVALVEYRSRHRESGEKM